MALAAIAAPTSTGLKLPGNTGYGILNPGTTVPGTTTPTAPASPTKPGGIDYTALLKNDPFYSSTVANNAATGVDQLGRLNAARQNAFVNYGSLPSADVLARSNAGDFSGAIDQTTRDLAAQNTAAGTSTTARLARAYQQAQEGDTANLAARGMLHSGAFGQHATEDLGNYNQASSAAQGQLLDYLNGLYSGYQSQQQALGQSNTQAQGDALQRIIAQIQAGLLGGGTGGGPPPPAPPPGGQPAPKPTIITVPPKDPGDQPTTFTTGPVPADFAKLLTQPQIAATLPALLQAPRPDNLALARPRGLVYA